MKIALLGYGLEGRAVEQYFKDKADEIKIFDNFSDQDIDSFPLNQYDLVFRSPSVRPRPEKNWTSITRYFFEHCPCSIIGATGTKGKGTTCSMISTILRSIGKKVHLLGNIGFPAISELDKIQPDDIVVYEMSSFQLWDLAKSPHVAVVLRIEPDHLNVHKDFAEYVEAKSHIAAYQTTSDFCVYFRDNSASSQIANLSSAHKIPYPLTQKSENLVKLLDSLKVPGDHNRENAEAALLASAAFLEMPLEDFIDQNFVKIQSAFANFQGLPHHIEFVRELNGVSYYDDSFSASYPSLEVALKAFPAKNIILIAGGKNRNLDLSPAKRAIFNCQNLTKAILIGETKTLLSTNENPDKFILCDDLKSAVDAARELAEKTPNSIVLLSPGAASFDMFKNFYDRGDQFQALVKDLQWFSKIQNSLF